MNPSLPINDIQLAFTDEGSVTPTILLIHGHPFNRTMWRPQVEFLQKLTCRSVALF